MIINFILFGFYKTNEIKDTNANRDREKFPTLQSGDYQKYFSSIENYLSDNFILRYKYIGTINYVKHYVFNFSNANKKVIYGKDGWMFLNACIHTDLGMDEYFGLNPWTARQTQNAVRNLSTVKMWCDKNNILFIPIICPSKHSVYNDKLPGMNTKYQNNRYDNLMLAAPALINLKEVLITQKSKMLHPLYYKTDTHWNALGSYFAVIEISKVLHKKYSDSPILGLNDILITQTTSNVGKDLANMVVLKSKVEEINVEITLKKQIKNKINRVYIIHDSFYDFMDPEMKLLFNEVQTRGIYQSRLSTKELLKNKPDVFIYEIVERYLDELNDLDKILVIDGH